MSWCKRLRRYIWCLAFGLILGALAFGFQKGPATSSSASLRKAEQAQTAFVGSVGCRECHPAEAARWSQSWHARALAPARSEFVVGRFNGDHYKGTSSEAWMNRAGAEYQMRTINRSGELADYPIGWLIGGKRMQDTLTVMADGAWQVLPVYFHVTGGGTWVDYTEAKQGALSTSHPFFWTNFRRNANHECLDCHTTGLKTGYDREAQRWRTEFADPGVACESCHGPGGRHAETASAADIVNPARIDRDLAFAICGQCHGPRQPLFPILDESHHFRPGDRYDEFYQAVVVVDGPDRSGDFFADGRPKSSSYEYQALLQSRCYLTGKATCLTCHSAPHGEHVSSELKPGAAGDRSCRNCHAAILAQGTNHTHHTGKEAQSCVACHMPKVVSGVLDHFVDHALDVPAPLNTARHGIPSACGDCHEKKEATALQQDLLRLWPAAGKRQARRQRLADAIDEATAAQSETALVMVIGDATESPALRGAAAVLLGQRFPARATAPLIPLLRHPSSLLRARALEGLGFAKSKESADRVAELMSDSSVMVRQMAALVLTALGDPRAQAALRHLADDPQTSGLARPHLNLGMAELQRGNPNQGIEDLEHAVDRMPYLSDALAALARAYLGTGRPGLARERAMEALHFAPQNATAARVLAQLPPR